MRTGNNPMTQRQAALFPPVMAAVITHLPALIGYHKDRLEVVQTCLESMRAGAGIELPFLIWDNGSCPELLDWITGEFMPDFLIKAPNMGKSAARTSIMRMLPFETIVCMSDDDMYFYPDWLEPQIKLLKGFPNAGVVSGYPVRTQHRWGNRNTIKWAKKNAQVKTGKFIPADWDRDFCISIGRDYSWHSNYTAKDRDILIEYKGMQAYATAHHCQFIAYAGRLQQFIQWDGSAMRRERAFDMAVDEAGMLRLTTVERLTRHIGNVLDDDIRALAREEVYA